MEFTGLSELLPLGGAGVLMVYLLKILVSERRWWVRERENLIAENERLKEEHNRQMQAKEEYWRKRCNEAERRAYGFGENREL